MAQLLVIGLLLQAGVSTATEDRLGHCSDTTSKKEPGLQLKLGAHAKSHTCANEPHVTEFETMMTQCSSFCGPKRINLLLGTESTGFNRDNFDSLCVGQQGSNESLLTYEPATVAKCEVAYEAIDRIKLRVADFIAAVRNITYSQQLFKASMIDKVNALQTVMFSAETKEEMDLASVSEKMTKLTTILSDNMADVMKSGILSRDLQAKLDNLEKKAELMEETIDDKIGQLDIFIEDCNTLMLGTSSANEYLLDICSVTSDKCVEDDEGRHVGCCCGIIPAAGVFSIQGNFRRLTEEEPVVDACGEAYALSQPSVDALVEEILRTSEGRRILDEFDQSQKAKYSDFYSECDRRLAGAQDLFEDAAVDSTRTIVETVQSENTLATKDQEHTPDTSRQLEGLYLTCSPPDTPSASEISNVEGNLKVAFADTTETALCKNIDGMTNEKLGEMCAEFCAPSSVPFVLGSLAYGFTQAEMDQVCLKPDDTYYNEADIRTCHEQGKSFNDLQRDTATLVGKLELLENAKLLFEAKAADNANKLQTLLIERAETEIDDVAESKKLNALRSLVQDGLADFMSAEATSTGVKDAAKQVKAAAEKLRTTIETVIPALKSFMANCNTLMTGVGSQEEYLLDLCSQTSRECIDAAEGRHVGCCCGYNPITSLGTSADITSNPTTIDGIKELAASSEDAIKYRVGSRRLSQLEASVNICGEAVMMTKADIAKYKAELDQINPAMWEEAQRKKRTKYPEYWGRCGRTVYSPATATPAPEAANEAIGRHGVFSILFVLYLTFNIC